MTGNGYKRVEKSSDSNLGSGDRAFESHWTNRKTMLLPEGRNAFSLPGSVIYGALDHLYNRRFMRSITRDVRRNQDVVLVAYADIQFVDANYHIIGVVGGRLAAIQIAALLLSIFPTEKALKKNFNADGTK